jgi:hypothetical protein
MTVQRAWCDCCGRSVDVIGNSGLCLPCYMMPMVFKIITKETDLPEDDVVNLTKCLLGPIFSVLIQRLQVPGQEHPLAAELLQSMPSMPREQTH